MDTMPRPSPSAAMDAAMQDIWRESDEEPRLHRQINTLHSRVLELEAQLAGTRAELRCLEEVASRIVAHVGPPLPPEVPLAVRLAWVGGLIEGKEG